MNSIRARLLLTLLIGLAIVLCAGGTAIYFVARAGLVRQFDDGLLTRARTLASLVKREPEQLVFESSDAPGATIDEIWFELRTTRGEVLKRSANLAGRALPARSPGDTVMMFDRVDLPTRTSGRLISMGFRPRIDPEDWQGHDANEQAAESLVVALAMNTQALDDALRVLLMSLLGVGATVAFVAGLLVAVGVRWALDPLARLGRRIAGVSGAKMAQRLDARDPPHELAPVYAEVNAMLDRVEQTLTRERSFIDAAAHELRTPLAELRAATDVALIWPDAPRAAATLRMAQTIGVEMEGLVEALLQISRANYATADCAVQPTTVVKVAPLMRNCVAQLEDRIREKRLHVDARLRDSDELTVRLATPEPLRIVLRNLIDNAVTYTPAEGRIAVFCEPSERAASSVIVENGPVALRPHHMPRLFEPFWRLDGARSDRRHAGLGLTVVRHVAASCGLRVDAQLCEDRLRVRIESAERTPESASAAERALAGDPALRAPLATAPRHHRA